MKSIKNFLFFEQKESRQDALDEEVKEVKEAKEAEEVEEGLDDDLLYPYQGAQPREPSQQAGNNIVEWAALKELPHWSRFDPQESRQDALDEVDEEVKQRLDDDLLYSYQGAQPREPPHQARNNSVEGAAREKLRNWSRFDDE